MKISILVHAHKPLGICENEIRKWYETIYAPLFFMLRERPELKIAVYNNYVLWKWLIANGSDFTVLLAELLADKRVEILGGAAYEPLIPLLSEEDSIAHFGEMSRLVEDSFSVLPKGVWCDYRLWEPSMTTLLSKAEVDYVVLNKRLSKDGELGPLIAEDRGNVLRVFPSHAIDAADHRDFSNFISNKTGNAGSSNCGNSENTLTIDLDVTNSHHLVSEKEMIGVSEIFGPVLDHVVGLVKEEVLSPTLFATDCEEESSAGKFFHTSADVAPLRERIADSPGTLSLYRKMLQVGRKIEFSGRSTRDIRESILKGQSATGLLNDCTCSTSALRNPLWFNLLQAEDMVDSRLHGKGSWVDIEEVDYNGDGKDELLVGSRQLNAYFSPHNGGSLFEVDFKQSRTNLLDVIVPDSSIFSGAFVDLFPNVTDIAGVKEICSSPADSGWGVCSPYESRVISDRDTRIELGRTGDVKQGQGENASVCSVSLEKTFRFVADQPSFKVRYRLINHSDHELVSPFAVSFGMKVPDCSLSDYLLVDERPVGDTPQSGSPLEMVQSFTIVDPDNGCQVRVQFTMCSELLIVSSEDLGSGSNGIGLVPQWSGPLPAGEILELDFTVDFEKIGGMDA